MINDFSLVVQCCCLRRALHTHSDHMHLPYVLVDTLWPGSLWMNKENAQSSFLDREFDNGKVVMEKSWSSSPHR